MPLAGVHRLARSKPSKKARKFISKKIKHLVEKEGKTIKQAAGQAYAMGRARGFKIPEPKT